jgi:hypothetical protein
MYRKYSHGRHIVILHSTENLHKSYIFRKIYYGVSRRKTRVSGPDVAVPQKFAFSLGYFCLWETKNVSVAVMVRSLHYDPWTFFYWLRSLNWDRADDHLLGVHYSLKELKRLIGSRLTFLCLKPMLQDSLYTFFPDMFICVCVGGGGGLEVKPVVI